MSDNGRDNERRPGACSPHTPDQAGPDWRPRHHDRTPHLRQRSRMTVSRRLRFEILRRDGHTCRYCGGSAPDVALTVDHVKPAALGGSDDPTNLVTACTQCNSGKASVAPDSPLVVDVADDALRWAKAISLASEAMLAEHQHNQMILEFFDDVWSEWRYGPADGRIEIPRPNDWRESVLRFVSLGLNLDIVCDMVRVAMGKDKVKATETWTYFCGCCWRQIDKLQEMAKGLVGTEGAA